ncbi:patatin-like phospholipase family protein [Rhizobium leguminosarum]|uniref:patatin-like phospholipase family protein n=1 Tax=Rhizobium leguminosarum TaxID=384 RepID=UPI001F22DDE7|nr:patatin-like phospholipase family protein [Rhizobium leguminosarum]UIJ83143.1 patatin-like phospholipase family protein [Rhizobium leguminosarum]
MSAPEQSCDLVMKGGITSGVVYPKAVVKLSRRYRFRNIGGTSAGAIAAVVTAAAEYGRADRGFEKIEALPQQLSATLLEKFQPRPEFRPIFNLMLAAMTKRMAGTLFALLKGYPVPALLGAIPAIIVAIMIPFIWQSMPAAVLAVLLFLFLLVLLPAATAAFVAARDVVRGLPKVDYGLCSGMTQSYMPAGHPALTEWLADTIDIVAGRPATGAPLGVKDLQSREVLVQTVTTDITSHRPYVLPMENNLHYFSEREFRSLFPARVVDAMLTTPKEGSSDLYPFKIDNLPLVVLARMSLSFPALISAVPLYRIDYTLVGVPEQDRLVRCMFSDGGLSSNFPVHFFDRFLPSRPTFGISLGEYDRRREKPETVGETRVFLPTKAGQGQLLPTRDFTGLVAFVFALFDSAKDWQDSLQSILAGYRERIVTVSLKPEEGGFNLDMPPDRINQLIDFGERAGDLINSDFKLDEHKWRRYLVEVRALDEMLRQFADAYVEAPEPGSLGYGQIATDYAPSSYKELTPSERQILRERAEAIAALGKAFQALQPLDGFDDHLPKSRSRIRSVARMDY